MKLKLNNLKISKLKSKFTNIFFKSHDQRVKKLWLGLIFLAISYLYFLVEKNNRPKHGNGQIDNGGLPPSSLSIFFICPQVSVIFFFHDKKRILLVDHPIAIFWIGKQEKQEENYWNGSLYIIPLLFLTFQNRSP